MKDDTAYGIGKELSSQLASERVARHEAESGREKLTTVLEGITDAFVAFDHEWRYTYINQQGEILLQRKREELIGRSVWGLYPDTLGTIFDTECHRAVAEQTPVEFEEYYTPLHRWFEKRCFPTKDGLIIYFRDITERKRIDAALPQPPAEELENGNETILLVENEDMVRSLTSEVLERNGYRVLEASSGWEAIELCQRNGDRIDLLITEMVMPQMSGRELAERLLKVRPQMRVIFMSGYTDDAILQRGVMQQDVVSVGKPFMTEELMAKVRETLDKKVLPDRG